VFTNYIEHIIENNNSKEDIYKIAVDVFYPEKNRVKSALGEFENEEEEIQAWIKKIEKEAQDERDKKAKSMETKQEDIEQTTEPDIKLNTEEFDHLEKEMEEDE
jgi:ATPase subunit of ABC transporter with duplicated ATPase domains